MVELRRICADEQLYVWAVEQLSVSFPACERRDEAEQRAVMAHPDYRLCAIMDGGVPVGVVGYFDTPEFIYFENFGSQALRLLTITDKPFILEIEPPEDELTRRRLAFYQRNGMVVNPYPHIQPHYRADDTDLPLTVLSYGCQITQAQYDAFRAYLDANVDVKGRQPI